jgi:hypothetical protein
MSIINYRGEEHIAHEFFRGLSWTERVLVGQVKTADEMIEFHGTVGRHIRNYYKLWEHPWAPEVVDGVDVSPNHPDAISMRILKIVWHLVHEGL